MPRVSAAFLLHHKLCGHCLLSRQPESVAVHELCRNKTCIRHEPQPLALIFHKGIAREHIELCGQYIRYHQIILLRYTAGIAEVAKSFLALLSHKDLHCRWRMKSVVTQGFFMIAMHRRTLWVVWLKAWYVCHMRLLVLSLHPMVSRAAVDPLAVDADARAWRGSAYSAVVMPLGINAVHGCSLYSKPCLAN